jgi:hypothetical protein
VTLRASDLGTDAVGRGAGWQKTNNTIAVSMALADLKARTGMSGPELFGAMVENVIAAIQGSTAPLAWREAGAAVAREIQRRMVAR